MPAPEARTRGPSLSARSARTIFNHSAMRLQNIAQGLIQCVVGLSIPGAVLVRCQVQGRTGRFVLGLTKACNRSEQVQKVHCHRNNGEADELPEQVLAVCGTTGLDELLDVFQSKRAGRDVAALTGGRRTMVPIAMPSMAIITVVPVIVTTVVVTTVVVVAVSIAIVAIVFVRSAIMAMMMMMVVVVAVAMIMVMVMVARTSRSGMPGRTRGSGGTRVPG